MTAGHAHPHHHGHEHRVGAPTLGLALTATLAFVVVEGLAGWWGHSLALLSDAIHNLTDAAALGLSWYAIRLATRPSHHGMTYGYHRVGVLAALINALTLVLIAMAIGWEAIARLRTPEPANGALMMTVASAAIVVNGVISWKLHAGARDDINVRGAYLHMLGDAISAAAVVVAGSLVAITHQAIADPIVSLLIGAFILYSSYGVFRESLTVLLEGTPAGLPMVDVIAAIRRVAGVLDVHDLHVWMIGPGVVACSCHIVVAEQSARDGQQVARAVEHDIEHRFRITHTTIQVEVEGCPSDDVHCAPQRS